jgi:hypothetical protein
VLVLAGMALTVYGLAAAFGRGGRGYFSPDTLELYGHSELLIPWTNISIYHGRPEHHSSLLADHLVARGYWTRSVVAEPRWVLMFRWNQQWKDGQSSLHREIVWRAEFWVKWTDENPTLARAMWPRVLAMLRTSGDAENTAHLMYAAARATNVAEFEKNAAEIEAAAADTATRE